MTKQEITNFKDMYFGSWNNIYTGHGNKISSFWGKTYFYINEKTNKKYAETLTFIGRIFHALFGYKKYLNRENFWKLLKVEKIVDDKQALPANKVFRKNVGDILAARQKAKDDLFAALRQDKNKYSFDAQSAEAKIIEMFDTGKVEINVVDNGCYTLPKLEGSLESALTAAIRNRMYRVAKYLIKKGADFGTTPKAISLQGLMHDLQTNEHIEMINILINSGKFDLSEKNSKGENLLHAAVSNHQIEIAKTLLASPKKDELINAQSKDGSTPLELACNKKDFAFAKFLLENEAPPSAKALSNALFLSPYVQKQTLKQDINTRLPFVDLFVGKGQKLEGEMGCEMLNRAAQSGDLALVIKVLDKFPNLHTPNGALFFALNSVPHGWEPITQQQRIAIAKSLIAKGAKLDGATPEVLVRRAVESGEKYILAFLFKNNPDLVWLSETRYPVDRPSQHHLSRKYPYGMTLLQLAEWYKLTEIVDYLKAEVNKAWGKKGDNKVADNIGGEKVPSGNDDVISQASKAKDGATKGKKKTKKK